MRALHVIMCLARLPAGAGDAVLSLTITKGTGGGSRAASMSLYNPVQIL